MSNSHQISQSTYSLLFFRGQLGYKFTRVVEDTQKNKTAGHKGVSPACGLRAYLLEHKYSVVLWPWGILTDGKAEEAKRQKLTYPAVLIFKDRIGQCVIRMMALFPPGCAAAAGADCSETT